MRVVVTTASIYSELALGLVLRLCQRGHRPAAVVALRMRAGEFKRKLSQAGSIDFVSYAVRRVLGDRFRPWGRGTFQDPVVAEQVRRVGRRVRHLGEAARVLGIPLIRCWSLNSRKSIRRLAATKPTLVLYAGGGILRASFLAVPEIGVLNAHAGPVPAFRGMSVPEWCVLHDGELGVTVHLMDAGIDTGPVLEFVPLPITERIRDLTSLRQALGRLGNEALVRAVEAFAKGEARPVPQPSEGGRTFFVMHRELLLLAEMRLRDRVAG
jgi:formyl transferase-like protein